MGFLRSVIPHGLEISRRENYFHNPAFCLDCNGNFVIMDIETDEIKFFTKEGTLFLPLFTIYQSYHVFVVWMIILGIFVLLINVDTCTEHICVLEG